MAFARHPDEARERTGGTVHASREESRLGRYPEA